MRHDDTLAYAPRMLRLEHAARYVAVSPSTFLRLINEGQLPKPVKVGGVVAWDRLELDSAVEDWKTQRENADTLANFFSGD